MKRSPMKRSKPMPRSVINVPKSRLTRRRIKPKRATPRKDRWTAEEWTGNSIALFNRCSGNCWRCGLDLGGDGGRHHRKRKRDGGDFLSNVILLHTNCHTWVHAHPEESRQLGWIVSAFKDPEEAPIFAADRGWILIDNAGQWVPATPPVAPEK